jgi:ATP-dependent Clp protease adapter protein ClpS
MTSSDPEVLRRQIEDTRRELSYDVDALNEKVNPARVVDRRMEATRGRITRAKEKVMGSAHDTGNHAQGLTSQAQDKAHGAAQGVQDAASSAAGAVQQAPDQVIRQTQGNPLAAGLIAFGVGWLVSSLLPTSEKERQLAQQAETAVKEHKDELLAPAKQAAQEIGEELKPAAQQAVEDVKSTAQDATQTVKDEGQSAARDVQGQAQDSKEKVQSQSSS